jgi:hypothetical protein
MARISVAQSPIADCRIQTRPADSFHLVGQDHRPKVTGPRSPAAPGTSGVTAHEIMDASADLGLLDKTRGNGMF